MYEASQDGRLTCRDSLIPLPSYMLDCLLSSLVPACSISVLLSIWLVFSQTFAHPCQKLKGCLLPCVYIGVEFESMIDRFRCHQKRSSFTLYQVDTKGIFPFLAAMMQQSRNEMMSALYQTTRHSVVLQSCLRKSKEITWDLNK